MKIKQLSKGIGFVTLNKPKPQDESEVITESAVLFDAEKKFKQNQRRIIMRAAILFLFIFILSFLLFGCFGERVTIQTGEVGKELGSDGLEDKIRDPGSFRMDSCIIEACPKLVRLETSLSTKMFTIGTVFLPLSNVDMTKVEVGVQFRIKSDKESVNSVFKNVRPVQANKVPGNEAVQDIVLLITSNMVYDTYIERIAPNAVIAALREYTVEQILVDVNEISLFTKAKINEMLKDTPIEVTELGFPNGIGEPPPEVIEAKRNYYAVQERSARRIKELQADLEIEKYKQQVQVTRVVNDKQNAETLGLDVKTYIFLKVLEKFADEHVPFGGYIPNILQ